LKARLREGEANVTTAMYEAGYGSSRGLYERAAVQMGITKSYCEIAKELGQPTAARAVARACATNPVSILIPCHRVVREDGGLGGYRWGLDRKRKLLEQERRAAEGPDSP